LGISIIILIFAVEMKMNNRITNVILAVVAVVLALLCVLSITQYNV
jgi:hypothetical protein